MAVADENSAALLQCKSASGHAIGFQAGGVYVASTDHMLRVDLIGAEAAMAPLVLVNDQRSNVVSFQVK